MHTLQLDIAQTLYIQLVILVVYIWKKCEGTVIFDIRISGNFVWFVTVNEIGNLTRLWINQMKVF
jgi:hypothetical protein